MTRSRFLVSLFCATACASSAPKPTLYKPEPPLARSSIATVLEHRDELQLSDEQVQKMFEIDQKRAQADRDVEVDLEQQLQNEGHLGGSARVSARGRGRGAAAQQPGQQQAKGEPPGESDFVAMAQQRLDENDTNSWTQAEALLSDAQKPRAKEIVAQYRDAVTKQREKH